MKSNVFLSLFLVPFFLTAAYCQKATSISGTGPVVKQSREASGFTKVSHNISGNVYITAGSGFKVEVEGQENILGILETKVESGTLKIQFKPNTSINDIKTLNVYVTAPSYEALNLNGSGDMVAENALKGNSLSLNLSGSGNLKVSSVSYSDVSAAISGSGNLTVGGGTADKVSLSVTGSGDLKADDLKGNVSEAKIVGSGDITCSANNSLSASIVGSGDIRYKGSPQVNVKISGSGEVSKLQ